MNGELLIVGHDTFLSGAWARATPCAGCSPNPGLKTLRQRPAPTAARWLPRQARGRLGDKSAGADGGIQWPFEAGRMLVRVTTANATAGAAEASSR